MGCARSSAVHVENSVAKVENVVSTVLDWALQTAPCTVGDVRIVRGALAQALHRKIEILEFSLHEGTARGVLCRRAAADSEAVSAAHLRCLARAQSRAAGALLK